VVDEPQAKFHICCEQAASVFEEEEDWQEGNDQENYQNKRNAQTQGEAQVPVVKALH